MISKPKINTRLLIIYSVILSASMLFFVLSSGIIKLSAYNAQTIKSHLQNELKQHSLTLGSPIYIRIFKASSELELWVQSSDNNTYTLFKTYPICTYSGELGPKLKEGDRQSPEGFYAVSPRQMNPNSSYHLSFNLGFPNAYDRSHGRTGSYLMIHGNCVSSGCFAMTDEGIEEIYTLADEAHKNGQKSFSVHSFPFRMTAETMQNHTSHPWYEFWLNLQEAYDAFETTNTPPHITVKDKHYLISLSTHK